jgi:hypothetical protein
MVENSISSESLANQLSVLAQDGTHCMNCGELLLNNVKWKGAVWDPSTPEATNINWLAQAQRRLDFPIDSTERTPMVALEYVWKVFNNLYDPTNGSVATL